MRASWLSSQSQAPAESVPFGAPLSAHEDCSKAGLRNCVFARVLTHVRGGCKQVELVHNESQDSQAKLASGSRRLVSLIADALTPFHRYTRRQLTAERAARLKPGLAQQRSDCIRQHPNIPLIFSGGCFSCNQIAP